MQAAQASSAARSQCLAGATLALAVGAATLGAPLVLPGEGLHAEGARRLLAGEEPLTGTHGAAAHLASLGLRVALADWAARLPGLACFAGLLMLTVYLGRRVAGPGGGWAAGSVLLTAPAALVALAFLGPGAAPALASALALAILVAVIQTPRAVWGGGLLPLAACVDPFHGGVLPVAAGAAAALSLRGRDAEAAARLGRALLLGAVLLGASFAAPQARAFLASDLAARQALAVQSVGWTSLVVLVSLLLPWWFAPSRRAQTASAAPEGVLLGVWLAGSLLAAPWAWGPVAAAVTCVVPLALLLAHRGTGAEAPGGRLRGKAGAAGVLAAASATGIWLLIGAGMPWGQWPWLAAGLGGGLALCLLAPRGALSAVAVAAAGGLLAFRGGLAESDLRPLARAAVGFARENPGAACLTLQVPADRALEFYVRAAGGEGVAVIPLQSRVELEQEWLAGSDSLPVGCVMPQRVWKRRRADLAALGMVDLLAHRGEYVLAGRPRRGTPAPPAVLAGGPPDRTIRSAALEARIWSRPARWELWRLGSPARLLVRHLGSTPEGVGEAPQPALELRFTRRDTLTVRVAGPTGTTAVTERFADLGEHFYGVWAQPMAGALDNRGAAGAYLGGHTGRGVNHASARAPFFLTSRGIGVYVPGAVAGDYRFGVAGETTFRFAGRTLEYHVFHAPTPAGVLRRHRDLAGPSLVPPTWALGTHWWRDDQHDDLGPGRASPRELALDDAAALRRHRIPAAALWFDRPYGTGRRGWGRFDFAPAFGDPAGLIAELDRQGLQVVAWGANRFWERPAGAPARHLLSVPDGYALDMAPPAREWLQERLGQLTSLGVRGFKLDRGDEGEFPAALENRLARETPAAFAAALRAAAGDQGFLISRSAADGARADTALWGGDPQTSFAGLRMSLVTGLRSGLIHYPTWGSDAGGYAGPPPSAELFARWLAVGAYSPVMEVLVGPRRTLWRDAPHLVEIARRHCAEHHDLIPYTRSCLAQARQTGMPVLRPLFLDFPDDARFGDHWEDYLYGPSLLVAPVMEEGATRRRVLLPPGRWFDSGSGRVLAGPGAVTLPAPLEAIPVLVREGAIIPRGSVLRGNDDWTPEWRPRVRVEVYPGSRRSEFTYHAGEEAAPARSGARRITCEPRRGGWVVRCQDLGVATRLEVRCGRPRRVLLNGQPLPADAWRYDAERRALLVPVSGPAELVVEAAGLFAAAAP